MGILPGITTTRTRNPPEEWDFIGNYQLIYADSGQYAENARKQFQDQQLPYILTMPT
jgi:hypothetical protein